MGDIFSVPSKNPSDTQTPIHMSSSENSLNLPSKSEKSINNVAEPQTAAGDSDPPSSEGNKTQKSGEQINIEEEGEGDEEDEEEEGECGFCLFMKGGGCRESFIAWENCIEEAEEKKEDIVEKCFEVTGNLKKCMEAHRDYYAPILQAEKAAEEEATKELQKEKEREAATSESSSDQNSSEGS